MEDRNTIPPPTVNCNNFFDNNGTAAKTENNVHPSGAHWHLKRGLGRTALHVGKALLVVRPLHQLDHRSTKHVLVGERQGRAEPQNLHARHLDSV